MAQHHLIKKWSAQELQTTPIYTKEYAWCQTHTKWHFILHKDAEGTWHLPGPQNPPPSARDTTGKRYGKPWCHAESSGMGVKRLALPWCTRQGTSLLKLQGWAKDWVGRTRIWRTEASKWGNFVGLILNKIDQLSVGSFLWFLLPTGKMSLLSFMY